MSVRVDDGGARIPGGEGAHKGCPYGWIFGARAHQGGRVRSRGTRTGGYGSGLDADAYGCPVVLGGEGEGDAGYVGACDDEAAPVCGVDSSYDGAVMAQEAGCGAGRVSGAVKAVKADNDVGRLCCCREENLFYGNAARRRMCCLNS